MRRQTSLRTRAFAVAALLLGATGGPSLSQIIRESAEWMPGEVILKLRADAFRSSAYRPELAGEGRTGLVGVDAELAALSASAIENLIPVPADAAHAERKREMGLDRVLLVRYRSSETAPEAALRLAQSAEVEYAHANSIGHASLTPNDPSYTLQWAHRNRSQAIQADGDSVGTWDCDLDSNQAWDIQTGSFSIVVAVLDTGLDRGHPEFSGRAMSGWDHVNEDSDPTDDNGHGTSCAGILAAAGNNGQGVAGVAWGVRILPVKVLGAGGNGSEADLVQGIVYATDSGARILSMSLGRFSNSATLRDAVRYAFNLDVTMFAASGNDNVSSVDYPAAFDEVIAVGAISPCEERKDPASCDGEDWWGSNYGSALDLVAPGVLIHTTDIRGGPGSPNGGAGGYTAGDYTPNFDGTSAATPFAAGVAALVLSQVSLPTLQLRAIMTDCCDDIDPDGWDQWTGFGRINAYAALRQATGAVFVGWNTGVEDGSYRFPYNTVLEGVNIVAPGNYLVVKPGNYDESTPWLINKSVHIDAIDGGVTIR